MKAEKLSCPVINQYLDSYSEPPKFVRIGARGIIIKDNKILLTYESRLNRYMSPGGGIENTESFEECCVRELKEEAGLMGDCESSLTEIETDRGVMPKWLSLDEALNLFGEYESKTEDCMSMYFREYTIIKDYIKAK